jgi:hypothetical protein
MSLLVANTANYAGFGSVTAKFATIETFSVTEVVADEVEATKVVADEVETDTVTATGDIVTTADVTCNTLNYVALNPPILAYTTVPSMAQLVTQTISPGKFVYCSETRSFFKGLRNPEDTVILPSGTPWGISGYLTMVLRISQIGTADPNYQVLFNELFVGSTANVLPTSATRGSTGKFDLSWDPFLPYAGRVLSIVPDIVLGSSVIDDVAQFAAQYNRTSVVGPSVVSILSIYAKNYSGADTDFSSTFPKSVTVTLLFQPTN